MYVCNFYLCLHVLCLNVQHINLMIRLSVPKLGILEDVGGFSGGLFHCFCVSFKGVHVKTESNEVAVLIFIKFYTEKIHFLSSW